MNPQEPKPEPETAELKQWVLKMAELTGLSEDLEKFRAGCIEKYGSVEQAMVDVEAVLARGRAEMEKAFPPGQPRIEVGRKPAPGENVSLARISENLAIRIWGGDLASYSCHTFDFVNNAGQYIRTPAGVKIYSLGVGGGEVHSIEKSLELADPHNRPGSLRNSYDKSKSLDPNWETYVIPDGTVLCVKQPGLQDRIVNIPMRFSQGSTVTLQTYRA
ncbi:hypothetical protein Hypma_010876 [Hypsizygus marmoreus]|uniref:Uncharacterized protein n=1 Tax=Hypsizygus marmoreus TaxID=39966 RepID=A0A369JNS5_HYPMA|nr:hypothetical protein Hypma_010876 [Hypsizygus marmoreus]